MAKYIEKRLVLDTTTYPKTSHQFIGLDFKTYIEYHGEDDMFSNLHDGRCPNIGERYAIVGIGSGRKGLYQSVTIHYLTKVNRQKTIDDLADLQLTADSKLFKMELELEPEDELYREELDTYVERARELTNDIEDDLINLTSDPEVMIDILSKINDIVGIVRKDKDNDWEKYLDQFMIEHKKYRRS